MTRARWSRVKRIFKAALDAPAPERPALLDRECGDDADVRQEVVSLLASLDGVPAGFLASTAQLDVSVEGIDGEPPSRVGPCRLIGPLGSSGVADTWLGELVEQRPWAAPGTRVVVKLVRPGLGHSVALRRLEREARLGSADLHPALVRAWESGREGEGEQGLDYLVLEQVDGRSLEDLIAELGQIPEPLLREVALEVSGALAALHARGIVHRDLRPACVLLTAEPRVRLASPGAAFVAAEPRISGDGEIVGPVRYAAPEILDGKEPTPAADVYALGVLLHEAATGAPAFPGSDLVEIMRAQLARRVPRLRSVVPEISQSLDDLVAWMLAPDPESRPAHAGEVHQALL